MGNDCVKANEDIGMNQLAKAAVGADANAISDDVLNANLPSDSLKQKVGLNFECTDLPNLDVGSKTDAFIVVWQINGKQQQRLGQTEVVVDNLNPKFVTTVNIDYYFELQQNLRIDVYDADDATNLQNLKQQDFVGSIEFQLGKLISSRNQELISAIANPARKNSGQLRVTAEEKKADYGKTQATFTLFAEGLPNGNCFVVINRFKGPGKYQPVFKSETKNVLGGRHTWNQMLLDTDTLCDANNDQEIMLQIFQYNASGNHSKKAQGAITLGNMIDGGGQQQLLLSGGVKLGISGFKCEERVSFLDYIFGGCEIGVQVAIDFTLSNGQPSNPESLHYLHPQTMRNGYTDAIHACLGILQNYDSDKQFPVYGFGGKLPGQSAVSHCFALNGDIFNPEMPGIDGVLRAYYESIKKVQLYGGTQFSSILSYANGFAGLNAMEMTQFQQKYTICLILTDGIINDLEKTIDEVVAGSTLPLSIIIVGIGNADFDQMEQLDADEAPLYSKLLRKYAARDIVQFVPFREVKNDPYRLAKEVLAEVPRQLVSYFASVGIKPNPPRRDMNNEINNLMQQKMMGMMKKKPENFFCSRKMMMVNHLAQQGLDPGQVLQFLDVVGTADEKPDLVGANMQYPGYQNPMRLQ